MTSEDLLMKMWLTHGSSSLSLCKYMPSTKAVICLLWCPFFPAYLKPFYFFVVHITNILNLLSDTCEGRVSGFLGGGEMEESFLLALL